MGLGNMLNMSLSDNGVRLATDDNGRYWLMWLIMAYILIGNNH